MASLGGSGGLPDIFGDQNDNSNQPEASTLNPERSFYNPITKDKVEFPQLSDVIKEYKKNTVVHHSPGHPTHRATRPCPPP